MLCFMHTGNWVQLTIQKNLYQGRTTHDYLVSERNTVLFPPLDLSFSATYILPTAVKPSQAPLDHLLSVAPKQASPNPFSFCSCGVFTALQLPPLRSASEIEQFHYINDIFCRSNLFPSSFSLNYCFVCCRQ